MRIAAVLVFFVLPLSTAAHAAEGTTAPIHGDVARGGAIADKWCTGCHDIGAGKATDQVPSFQSVSKRHRAQPAALRAFLRAPHKPMPPLLLSNQEIEDLAVYIEAQK